MEPEREKYLTISDLERATGIPKTTIKFYIREGLINPHHKTGKTMAYYTEEEARKLNLIKKLREKEDLSIKAIKEEMVKYDAERKSPDFQVRSIDRRQEIIETAARLFTQKGYNKVSIQDIVNELQMSKSTFYSFFNNKEELFLECTKFIFHQMFNEVWDSIRKEKEVMPRLLKRTDAFFDAYPKWRDMMYLLRGIAISSNEDFVRLYKENLQYIIQPIIRDVEKAIREGVIKKDINPEIVGFAFMGIGEYLAELLHIFNKYDKQTILEQVEKIQRLFLRAEGE
ncbi:MAG: MerR family transcriptional regulator [Syntrophomonadaceae bacterium]|nr:MerR family transcriptional regulator [Syntrophomonadaceae bacterium]